MGSLVVRAVGRREYDISDNIPAGVTPAHPLEHRLTFDFGHKTVVDTNY